MAVKEKLSPEEQMKKDYEESQKRSSGGGMFWTPEEGDNVLRFLPAWAPGENFYRKVFQHFGLVAANTKIGIYCPKENAGEECPACAAAQKLADKGGREDFKKANAMKAKLNYVTSVLVEATPSGDNEGDVKVFRFGKTVFDGLCALIMGKWGKVYDAVNGRAVCVKRVGLNLDTEYTVIPEPDVKPVPKDVLKKVFDLDDDKGVIEVFSGDEIGEIMSGTSLDDIRSRRSTDEVEARDERRAEPKQGAKAEPKKEVKAEAPAIDRKLIKKIVNAAVEDEIDLESEKEAEIVAEFKEKTQDLKVKSLSEETRELLEEMGADVSGKTVEWPSPKADESEAQDEDDDIKAQMEKLRAAKAKKK